MRVIVPIKGFGGMFEEGDYVVVYDPSKDEPLITLIYSGLNSNGDYIFINEEEEE